MDFSNIQRAAMTDVFSFATDYCISSNVVRKIKRMSSVQIDHSTGVFIGMSLTILY